MVPTLPMESEDRSQIVTYVRGLIFIDLGLAIVAEMSGDRVEKEMLATGIEVSNPIATARLITFTDDWLDCLEFARERCKMLDSHHGEPEGSAFTRMNRFLAHLRQLATKK